MSAPPPCNSCGAVHAGDCDADMAEGLAERARLLPSDAMAEQKRKRAPGGGRPREIGKEPGEVVPFRLGEQHLAELDALVAEGRAKDRSSAARLLIEESAERRAGTS